MYNENIPNREYLADFKNGFRELKGTIISSACAGLLVVYGACSAVHGNQIYSALEKGITQTEIEQKINEKSLSGKIFFKLLEPGRRLAYDVYSTNEKIK